jgi:predicted dehydrogenase
MGRQHALVCQSLGHRITFVQDVDPTCAQTLASQCPGAAILTGPNEIAWGDIDAVFICTPPHARGSVELAAARAGTPFFVEKPIGLQSAQCAPVLRELQSRPLVTSVGYMSRYRESVRRARAALDGRRVVGVSAFWLAGRYNKPWWLDRAQSGGPFNEQGTHFVDLCRYFGGEIDEVVAVGRASDVEHPLSVSCHFESGASASLLYSCLSQSKQMSFEILCTDGAVALKGYDLALEGSCEPTESALRTETETFCRAVSEGRRDLIESSFEDALRTQLVMDAIAESIATQAVTKVATLAALLVSREAA